MFKAVEAAEKIDVLNVCGSIKRSSAGTK